MRDIEPLDLLIASMIAETGEPDEEATAWLEQAMASAAGTVVADGQHRSAGPPGTSCRGDETATLLGSLERQRATLAWKCGELDAAGLSAMPAPSPMTLGGLLKHLALVEDHYFSYKLLPRSRQP